jgi:Barstar (barnase inhibitor)
MSQDPLDALLHGTPPNGVVRFPADGSGAPLLDRARDAGWQTAPLDLEGVRDKAAFLDRCATALRLPEWFGRNWDALADCLNDLSWWGSAEPVNGRLVLVSRWEGFRDAAPEEWLTAEDVFAAAVRYWSRTATPMGVFVQET